MTKRRSVMLGLGALATGSGAVFASGAFDSAFTDPSADLRVIADAQLRVRSVRAGGGTDADPAVSSLIDDAALPTNNLIHDTDTDYESTYDDFWTNHVQGMIDSPGKPEVAALQINEGVNDELGIRTAISNRLDGGFGPLIEITNDTQQDFEVGISYENPDPEDGSQGYGADVETGSNQWATDVLSKTVVQNIYQFKLDDTSQEIDATERNSVASDAGLNDDDLFSPDPTATETDQIEAANKVTLGPGETIFVKLAFNTSNTNDSNISDLVGILNSAASSGTTIGDINPNLDLLNTIWVSAEEPAT